MGEEHGHSMHCRPDRVLDAGTSRSGEDRRIDEFIERLVQQSERRSAGGSGCGRIVDVHDVIGHGERRIEEPRLL